MIFSHEEIKSLIKNPRNLASVQEAQEMQIAHDRHVSGKDFKKLIEPLKGFEHEDQEKVKNQLSKPASVPIVSELRKALAKWQSATDTHKSYEFKQKEKSTDFKKEILSKVWKGESMETFVNGFLKNGLWNKFNDFLIVNRAYIAEKEIDNKKIKVQIIDGVEKPYSGNDTSIYIAHIPINAVHDFKIFGNKVEYLVYLSETIGNVEYYKVIDDRAIYTVKYDKRKTGEEQVEIVGEPTPNELDELTAVRLSSLLSIEKTCSATSLLEPVISLLDTYVNKYAILEVCEKIHAFPQGWALGQACSFEDSSLDSSNCDGTGEIEVNSGDKRITIKCPKCKGTGWNTVRDASQKFIIPISLGEDAKASMSSPIGYASVPIDILEYLQKTLEKMELSIKDKTLNKNSLIENSIQKTATAVIENNAPVVILNMFFADLIEVTEKTLVNWIGRMYSVQYEKCVINYGLNYANKNKDQITEEIKEANISGISRSEVFDLQKKRIKAANNKDHNKMLWQMILLDLEPFPTLTIDQVESSQTILPIDKMKKLYFLQYIEELEIEISQFINKENYKKEIKKVKEQLKQLNKKNYDSTEKEPIDGGSLE